MARTLQVADPRVRVKLREALAAARGFGRLHSQLLEDVNFLLGGNYVDQHQLDRCLEWNLAEDFVRSKPDKDFDEARWFLTPEGQAKQNESLDS